MKIRTNIDRGLFLPIGIGVLSIVGIVLIALNVISNKPQASSLPASTSTPFKYLFLATETRTAKPESKLTTSTAAITNKSSPSDSPIFETTPNEDGTPAANATPVTTNSPTIDLNSVFTEGKYDDTDERVVYEGDWVNEIIETAFGQSSFISATTGDTAAFKFVGSQFHIGYLEDPGFGTVVVSIDGVEYDLDQSTGFEWISPELSPGEHLVILTHESGELIILDYIIIIASD